MATNGAQNETITTMVMNRYYIRQVQNSYWMQPKFFMILVLFTSFLSAATTVLTLETYRSKFCDFGTLRALGMRRRDIFFVNWITSAIVTLIAIPVAIGVCFGAVQLYKCIVAPFGAAADFTYTIDRFIPWGTLAVLAVFMILSALVGTTVVCMLYRTKTTLSLLRREGTFTVPFVSKTSPAFERSEGVGGYNRLYGRRARSMLLRYSAVTAVLLPLPMYYMFLTVTQLLTLDSASDQITLIYTVFQLVGVMITSMCVAVVAARMFTGSRVGEFAVMRALGADRRAIHQVAYSTAAWQTKVMLIFSLVLTWLMNGITATTYIDSTEGAKSVSEILLLLLGYGGSALLFIVPSVYGGLSTVLHRFFRRPIITAIREKE